MLFKDLIQNKHLLNAVTELGLNTTTPIQERTFSVIRSGKDVVGIAQTGTGKTFAYSLPVLQDLKFSKQDNPRILILVPTRELVLQVVDELKKLTAYMNVRILGLYGGTNIKTQKQAVAKGSDIIVATPGRLYDIALTKVLQLKGIKKLIIDEVDVMLDLGFRYQLSNILEFLPNRRQNIMFSATMTEEVDLLIDDYFVSPEKISIAVSGTPLDNIKQRIYAVPNFYTKINLLAHILKKKDKFLKVLVFVSSKKNADIVFEAIEEIYGEEVRVIHSNKSQNYRIRSVEDFDEGINRILISTDIMARGLDLNEISHVINFDTPIFPENYMHRIGRTGRAEKEGKSLLFYTPREEKAKSGIERLMDYEIPMLKLPNSVEISRTLTLEERPVEKEINTVHKHKIIEPSGAAFHEKKEKNKKENQGGSYKRIIAKKYKKPKTRGDKKMNALKKRK
ncbi:MAG: DEAD/DEAH box helicase [Bacteroidales bacterium]|nr:DEAD/DEAH box helicase [Bacteroidales bacterium]